MTKEEWLQRCAAQYVKVGAIESIEDAMPIAEGCYDAMSQFVDDDYADDPEGAADEDMSYWDDDGDPA